MDGMAIYYVIARMDGTRFAGPTRHRVQFSEALAHGSTYFIPGAPEPAEGDDPPASDEPLGLLVHPDPAQAGLGIADDMTLSLGVDGGFRLFQLRAVPAPEHYRPTSEVGSRAIVTRELLVTAEVPAWWAYGPSGRHVAGLLAAIATLERRQLEAIGDRASAQSESALSRFEALSEADRAIATSGRLGAARLARGYARAATYREWDRNSSLSRAATLAGDVAHLLVVRDLINSKRFDEAFAPFQPDIASIIPIGDDIEYGKVFGPAVDLSDLSDLSDVEDAEDAAGAGEPDQAGAATVVKPARPAVTAKRNTGSTASQD
jgi:hypothetical protein